MNDALKMVEKVPAWKQHAREGIETLRRKTPPGTTNPLLNLLEKIQPCLTHEVCKFEIYTFNGKSYELIGKNKIESSKVIRLYN